MYIMYTKYIINYFIVCIFAIRNYIQTPNQTWAILYDFLYMIKLHQHQINSLYTAVIMTPRDIVLCIMLN